MSAPTRGGGTGTEHKLSGLDPLLQNLRLRIRRVDGEILDAVRQQSTSGNRAKQDLDHANRAIQVSHRASDEQPQHGLDEIPSASVRRRDSESEAEQRCFCLQRKCPTTCVLSHRESRRQHGSGRIRHHEVYTAPVHTPARPRSSLGGDRVDRRLASAQLLLLRDAHYSVLSV